jgi:hypothetical protein
MANTFPCKDNYLASENIIEGALNLLWVYVADEEVSNNL